VLAMVGCYRVGSERRERSRMDITLVLENLKHLINHGVSASFPDAH
jgi:hypothetical protein